MADLKISALPASTVPLAGTEVVPIVQSSTTKQVSVQNILSSVQPTGTANGVAYLNGSKVLTTGTAFVFDGTNLGLAVTPQSAWQWPAFQIQNAALTGGASPGDRMDLSFNFFRNGAAAQGQYIANGFASNYRQTTGQHQWQVAASGTAGNAITFTTPMVLDNSGNLGLGTSSPSASAILDAQSTTKGVRMPNMTTTQKNAISSPATGLMVFDTTLAKLCVYSGAAWQTITSI